MLEGNPFGQVMQDALGHGNEAAHGAVHEGAVALSGGVEIVETAAAEGTVRIDGCGSFADGPIALLPPVDVGTDLADDSTEFVPKDHGVVHFPADAALPHVEIASADAHRRHLEENLVRPDGCLRDFPELYAKGIGGVVDEGKVSSGIGHV